MTEAMPSTESQTMGKVSQRGGGKGEIKLYISHDKDHRPLSIADSHAIPGLKTLARHLRNADWASWGGCGQMHSWCLICS